MVNRVSTYIYIFESGLEKHKPPVGRHLNGIRMTLRLSKRLSRHFLACRRLRIFGESFQSSKIDRSLVQQNRLIEWFIFHFPSSDTITIFHISRTTSIDHRIYQVFSRFGIKVEASIERFYSSDGWSIEGIPPASSHFAFVTYTRPTLRLRSKVAGNSVHLIVTLRYALANVIAIIFKSSTRAT